MPAVPRSTAETELERVVKRPADVLRLAIALILALVATACGNTPSPSAPSATPGASASPDAPSDDPAAALAAALQAAGSTVKVLGAFNTTPLGGRGVRLCLVAGQEVSVYAYETEGHAVAAAAGIDPGDPSKVGNAVVAWAGNPKFWQRDRVIVLYLGNETAVEARITSVLGEPFARGRGRDPGPAAYVC